MGWRRLPKKLPRPAYAAVYILLLLTAITSLSVVIVPRLTVSVSLYRAPIVAIETELCSLSSTHVAILHSRPDAKTVS